MAKPAAPPLDPRMTQDLDLLCINTIRTLSMDAVEAAKSGHPGTPMALAPVAYAIWTRHLRFDPAVPGWPNRDRFVLSAGHASMLLYSILHLAGVLDPERGKDGGLAITLDDIRNFRQLDSRCAGHPEHGLAPGIETTTGPLGQGVANSVGMAIAGRWLAARYDRPAFELFDHRVFVIASDGDLMEGISHEAASLAGHLKLGNLCWVYDNNSITIEGRTALAYSDDIAKRFAGYGWTVAHVADANDLAALDRALDAFEQDGERPHLIVVDSHIGFGAPHKQDSAAAHGEPLGEDEIRGAKRAYGWPEDAKFLVPDGVREHFATALGARGTRLRVDWNLRYSEWQSKYPGEAAEVDCILRRRLPDGWDADIPSFPADAKGLATRDSSGKVLNAIAKHVAWLLGGAADLAPSTKTLLTFDGAGTLEADSPGGRNMHFGIREHGMGAVLNGMSLSRLRPYGATFLIFSDYEKPALRLAAIMEQPVIQVFTHDSIGLGEDGTTHQPVEQLLALRSLPGMIVMRPADANEAAECWRVILPQTKRPVALVLTRQTLPTLDRTRYAPAAGVARGAYVLADAPGDEPELILIGTGSEVAVCVAAHEQLVTDGIRSRVVSMPSWELFGEQSDDYQESVLPPAVTARIAVEAASVMGWERWVGTRGQVIGMRTFGHSAPAAALMKRFGFTPANVVATAKQMLGRG
jgi:transketolase